MFKMDGFEEELYSSMKENLKVNSKKEGLKTQASNFKAIQFLNNAAEMLEKNNFTKQAEAITSYMGKRIGLKDVYASLKDKYFIDNLDKDTYDNLKYCFKEAGLDSDKLIEKKYFNEYDRLLDVKYSRAMKPVTSSEGVPVLYKGEVFKNNKYLENIKNIIINSAKNENIDDSKNIEVNFEEFEDE